MVSTSSTINPPPHEVRDRRTVATGGAQSERHALTA
jgi:hypothetical protein